jgi:hypothetical protein
LSNSKEKILNGVEMWGRSEEEKRRGGKRGTGRERGEKEGM